MNAQLRDRFDKLLEEVLAELPAHIQELLETVPVIAEDTPTDAVLERTGAKDGGFLCGLYTGIPLMHRSVEHSGTLPDKICIFREGIFRAAGSQNRPVTGQSLKRQIRITVLHEIGHHFGLNESDLRKLGYQ